MRQSKALKVLIVGNGGREAACARSLARDSAVYAVMGHRNPTIAACVAQSGGEYCIADGSSGAAVADFAAAQGVDYVFVNSDEPLAKGVVDVLLERGIKALGPTRAGARIEWDKIYAMEMMAQLFPECTPFYRVAVAREEVPDALEEFRRRGMEVVVKPQGLSGGKGVKVMGEHLATYDAAGEYAVGLLAGGEKVLLVEKVRGIEFTIMGLTDGAHTVFAPASYDYPYRYAGDRGAGTGGMGCFTAPGGPLPFMEAGQYRECMNIMSAVLRRLGEEAHFNGVLNGGFFLSAEGVKFMEFNARFGDPEGINILALLESSFSRVLQAMYDKSLDAMPLRFAPQASVVKYLVAPEYPGKGSPVSFTLPVERLREEGLEVYFSAAEAGAAAHHYRTVSSSRVVALASLEDDIPRAAEKINRCLEEHCQGVLEYRADIATAAELARLEQRAAALQRGSAGALGH